MYSISKRARQVEIELHRGELPGTADGVDQLHVDLGTVEGGLVGNGLHLHVEPLVARSSALSAMLPLLGRAGVLAAGAAVPGGKLGFVLIEAVGRERVDGELQAIDDFVFHLLRQCRKCGRRPG